MRRDGSGASGRALRWVSKMVGSSGAIEQASNPLPEARSGVASDETPRICIVTPVYNAAAYIDDVIASVVTQAGDFHLHYHVQDGGSTDGSQQIVARWQALLDSGGLRPLCRSLRFTTASAADSGMYDALNQGFAAALPNGDDVVMGWIGADDRIAPGAFSTLADLRRQVPEVRFISGRTSLLNEAGSVVTIAPLRTISQACMAAGLHDSRSLPFMMQEGTFWCADLWHTVGGLDAKLRLAGDWDLWRRLGQIAPCVTVDSLLGFHRRRPGQLSEHMDRYYQEVDEVLARPDPTEGTLGDRYRATTFEYERLQSDPAAFRNSRFPGVAVGYDHATLRWKLLKDVALPPLPLLVMTREAMSQEVAVQPVSGLGPSEEPLPQYQLARPYRWLREITAEGIVTLRRAARYQTRFRCRSWLPDQRLSIWVDDVLLYTATIAPGGHEQDVEVRAEVDLPAGVHRLVLHLLGPNGMAPELLVIDWAMAEVPVASATGRVTSHLPFSSVGSRNQPPFPESWPRISMVVAASGEAHHLSSAITSIVRQNYPNMELIVVGHASDGLAAIVARFQDHIAHVVHVEETDSEAVAGFAAADGDVLSFLADGEVSAAGSLLAAAQAFVLDTSDIVEGVVEIVGPSGEVLGRELPVAEGLEPMLTGRPHLSPGTFLRRTWWTQRIDRERVTHGAATATPAGRTTIGTPTAQRVQSITDGSGESSESSDRSRIVLFSDTGYDDDRDPGLAALARAAAALGYKIVPIALSTSEGADPGELWTVAGAILSQQPNLVMFGRMANPTVRDAIAADIAREAVPVLACIDGHWNRLGQDQQWSRQDPGQQGGPRDDADIHVDTAVFKPASPWRARLLLGLPGAAFIILAHGLDATRAASVDRLLDAVAGLAPHEVLLVISGGAMVIDREAPARVIFIDRAQNPEIVALYNQAADVVVELGVDAASQRRLAQAGGCGTAAIASGPTSVVLDGVSGILLDPSDSGALSDAVQRVRSDPGYREQLGTQAAALVRSRHSLEMAAIRLCGLLDRLGLAQDGAARSRLQVPVPSAPTVRYLHDSSRADGDTDRLWLPLTGIARSERQGWQVARTASLLLNGAGGGIHAVQFCGTGSVWHALHVTVNRRVSQMVEAPEPLPGGAAELRLVLDLEPGWNRLDLRFEGDSAMPDRADATAFLLDLVGLWPIGVLDVSTIQDGAVVLKRGFSYPEGPLPEANKPNRFWWVAAQSCELYLTSDRAGLRRVALSLRNPHCDQWLIVRIGAHIAAVFPLKADDKEELVTVEFASYVGVGPNALSLETTRQLQADETGRTLNFMYENICFTADEGARIPCLDSSDHADPNSASLFWKTVEGCGEEEGAFPEAGLLYPFRWITSTFAVVRFFATKAGPVELTLDVHNNLSGQAITIEDRHGECLAHAELGTDLSKANELTFISNGPMAWRCLYLRARSITPPNPSDARRLAYILGRVGYAATPRQSLPGFVRDVTNDANGLHSDAVEESS